MVVNYNAGRTLGRCLDSLAVEELAGVRVVDNDSRDGSQKMVPNDWLVQNDDNVGFARAVNAGVTSLGYDIDLLLLLNPDAWLLPDALSALALSAPRRAGRSRRAACSTRTAGQPFPRDVSQDGPLTLWSCCGSRDCSPMSSAKDGSRPPDTQVRRTVRRRLALRLVPSHRHGGLEEIGPLSEDFFLYGEELDWVGAQRRPATNASTSPRLGFSMWGKYPPPEQCRNPPLSGWCAMGSGRPALAT